MNTTADTYHSRIVTLDQDRVFISTVIAKLREQLNKAYPRGIPKGTKILKHKKVIRKRRPVDQTSDKKHDDVPDEIFQEYKWFLTGKGDDLEFRLSISKVGDASKTSTPFDTKNPSLPGDTSVEQTKEALDFLIDGLKETLPKFKELYDEFMESKTPLATIRR